MYKPMRKIVGLVIVLAPVLVPLQVLAQDAAEDAALMLADSAAAPVEKARDWHLSAEAAFGRARLRSGDTESQRLSLDFTLDTRLHKDWRLLLADQLDMRWEGHFSDANNINTLKEAYLSWTPQADQAFDFGRINARYGVALGFNPTDFFKAGANRSVTSIDPASLKKNRQGSVMLRGQSLWSDGSLTAIWSPKLAEHPSTAVFSFDAGATNRNDHYLLALSQQITAHIQPQFLLFGERNHAPQIGLNLTGLLNESTVAYAEWAGGRARSQLAETLDLAEEKTFYSKLSSGLTYTTSNKISLTAEWQYNGAALDRNTWHALPQQSFGNYRQYRRALQTTLDMPTRQAVFLYASWQDALLHHLDLSAMLRRNLDDRSSLSWLEARYRWGRADLALQWQLFSGSAASEFGASNQRQAAQLTLRYFF
ncbi:MAG: hypothetical protein V4805_03665 [Pseudomonadota bacterium]